MCLIRGIDLFVKGKSFSGNTGVAISYSVERWIEKYQTCNSNQPRPLLFERFINTHVEWCLVLLWLSAHVSGNQWSKLKWGNELHWWLDALPHHHCELYYTELLRSPEKSINIRMVWVNNCSTNLQLRSVGNDLRELTPCYLYIVRWTSTIINNSWKLQFTKISKLEIRPYVGGMRWGTLIL